MKARNWKGSGVAWRYICNNMFWKLLFRGNRSCAQELRQTAWKKESEGARIGGV
ncbi:hypothetical protein QG37_08196 [Candidozyma auris]|nr:hypothetical protein QG37_08196 [[Candida] auris]